MLPAIDDVHHRHWQDMGIYAANIAIERKATCIRRRFRYRKADAQNGIRAQVRFIVGAIQINHDRIDIFLLLGVQFDQGFKNWPVNGLNRLKHALAHIFGHIAIALFNGFIRTCRGARRDCRTAETAVLQHDINFNRRISPAVEDLACVNIEDSCHN